MKEAKASIHEQRARKTGNGFRLPIRKERDTPPPPTTSPPEGTGLHELPTVLRQERKPRRVEPAKPVTAGPKRRRTAALRLRSR